ncbi:MAG TPA: PLP-dependent transferase [Jatrophihabitans sp.]|jgi:cystathionine gamma-synthase
MRRESVVVSSGRPETPGAPLNTPVVLTAPYRHSPEDNAYSRDEATETRAALEATLGALDGGTALAYASGMAAVAAVAEGRPTGTVAVVAKAAYSGAVSIFGHEQELGRMSVRPVPSADTDAVLAALDGAGLLWLETVSNPLMEVPDLPVLIAAAHAAGALVCVDATFSTPLNIRPLELGADVVMHSVTKYLAGHSDVLMGALIVGSPELHAALQHRRMLTGAIPGALESYLALRGIRTLSLRMERAQANAAELAQRLSEHPRVARVRYPGLGSDPGHERAARLFDGFGAMLAIEVDGTADDAETVCERVRLISHATSLGGVESLIERRARYEVDAGFGTPANLLRLSVGIEHVEDLWDDLERALS